VTLSIKTESGRDECHSCCITNSPYILSVVMLGVILLRIGTYKLKRDLKVFPALIFSLSILWKQHFLVSFCSVTEIGQKRRHDPQHNDTQCNDTQRNVRLLLCWVSFMLRLKSRLLCWVRLCWMLLWWVSLCWMPWRPTNVPSWSDQRFSRGKQRDRVKEGQSD